MKHLIFLVAIFISHSLSQTIQIKSPSQAQRFPAGATIEGEFTVDKQGKEIQEVGVSINMTQLKTFSQAPYQFSFSNLSPGHYIIVAYAESGGNKVADTVDVVIKAPLLPKVSGPKANGKLKVFLLAGQSNMQRFGQVGGLDNPGSFESLIIQDPEYFSSITDENKQLIGRNDVWVVDSSKSSNAGWLDPGTGSKTRIGPEYGFGMELGDYYQDTVLIIKIAWGGRSLYKNFLPPTVVEYSIPQADGDTGFQYQELINAPKGILDNIIKYFPHYNGKGYELTGFGWFQGFNDKKQSESYENNLVHLIKGVRKDLEAPKLPVVIATFGLIGTRENMWGLTTENVIQHLNIINAQLAVSDDEKYPEFAGNVNTVDTRPFRRFPPLSSGASYHYHHNFETFYLVGTHMGHSMINLIDSTIPVSIQTGPTLSAHPSALMYSQGKLQLRLTNQGSYQILFRNSKGQVIWSVNGQGKQGLNLLSAPKLPANTYTYEFKNEDHSQKGMIFIP